MTVGDSHVLVLDPVKLEESGAYYYTWIFNGFEISQSKTIQITSLIQMRTRMASLTSGDSVWDRSQCFDSDNDGLSDGDEVFNFCSDPTIADSDGDTMLDGYEIMMGTDPCSPDPIIDGVPVLPMVVYGFVGETVVLGSGIDPEQEAYFQWFKNGKAIEDCQRRKLFSPRQIRPWKIPCIGGAQRSFAHSVSIEVLIQEVDADKDGLSYAEELFYQTDPLNPDSDGDGVSDGREVELGYDPMNPQSPELEPSPNVGTITDIRPEGEGLRITFITQLGVTYQIERSENLLPMGA